MPLCAYFSTDCLHHQKASFMRAWTLSISCVTVSSVLRMVSGLQSDLKEMASKCPHTIKMWNVIIQLCKCTHLFGLSIFTQLPFLAQITHFLSNYIYGRFYLQYIFLTWPWFSVLTDIIQDSTTISHFNKYNSPLVSLFFPFLSSFNLCIQSSQSRLFKKLVFLHCLKSFKVFCFCERN